MVSNSAQSFECSAPIPARAGVGLKTDHYLDILEQKPDIGWFEVHAENYMGEGGPPHHYLSAIRDLYPLSVHGVGLSIGADGPGSGSGDDDAGSAGNAYFVLRVHAVGAPAFRDSD